MQVPCVYRTAARDAVIGNIRVEARQRIFADIVKANLDVSLLSESFLDLTNCSKASAFGATPTAATYDKAGIFGLGDYG